MGWIRFSEKVTWVSNEDQKIKKCIQIRNWKWRCYSQWQNLKPPWTLDNTFYLISHYRNFCQNIHVPMLLIDFRICPSSSLYLHTTTSSEVQRALGKVNNEFLEHCSKYFILKYLSTLSKFYLDLITFRIVFLFSDVYCDPFSFFLLFYFLCPTLPPIYKPTKWELFGGR